MKSFTKFQKIIAGLGAAAGISSCYYLYNIGDKKVFASWTTYYEPSNCAKWDYNWDRRSNKELKPLKSLSLRNDENNNVVESEKVEKPKAIRHVILIRHGQYNLNGESDDQRTLTKLGQLQADYTGRRLKELGFPYSNIVKSTMTRAQETGGIIQNSLPQVPVQNCDLLREGAPIPPEPPVGNWKPSYYFYIDGARIEAAFRKYFHRADLDQKADSFTVLVCHANVIRYFVCRALQFPAEAWLRLSLNHGSITWISITPSGRVILRCLGDSGHMPPDVISSH